MECPHLIIGAKISSSLNNSDNVFTRRICKVCKSTKSPWICLNCGVVHCGRYVNGHAKAHYEEQEEHMVCMDCEDLAAYCYICDAFVINDTQAKHLEQLRFQLQPVNEPQDPPVKPRRRHRTNSGDSSGTENRQQKQKKKAKVVPSKGNGKLRVVGLRNLGNTCFMNAVLQSLSNIQQFCYYFKQLPALDAKVKNGKKAFHTRKCKIGDEEIMAEELRKTLVALWQGSKTAISPESLFTVIWRVVPRFRGYQQQDAHEFLRYMLDRLHTELLNILPYPHSSRDFIGAKGKSTIVTTIFGGVLQNEVNCLMCGTESKKHDPFLDLSLDIPHQYVVNKNGGKTKEEDIPVCKLSDCLNSFTALEELADTELYYCSNCKKKQKSTKKFWIRRLPNVLCLHLKRFRWNNCFRIKIDNYVKFPIHGLDMSKFILTNMHETRGSCSGNNLYDLAAVIVHHGTGAGSGHYTAYATHEGHWFHFNDSTVTCSDEETVAKCKAYIFFYIRREFKLPSMTA